MSKTQKIKSGNSHKMSSPSFSALTKYQFTFQMIEEVFWCVILLNFLNIDSPLLFSLLVTYINYLSI